MLTDIMGQSGRAVLGALAAGETDPARLQALVGPWVKASPAAIRAALTGRASPHHRFLLGPHLRQIDALSAAIAEIDAQVERDLGPFREAVGRLATNPGVADLTAQVSCPTRVTTRRGNHATRHSAEAYQASGATPTMPGGGTTCWLAWKRYRVGRCSF